MSPDSATIVIANAVIAMIAVYCFYKTIKFEDKIYNIFKQIVDSDISKITVDSSKGPKTLLINVSSVELKKQE